MESGKKSPFLNMWRDIIKEVCEFNDLHFQYGIFFPAVARIVDVMRVEIQIANQWNVLESKCLA